MAEMKSAKAVWTGDGLAFQGVLGSGYTFEMGSPAGEAQGSPMEFFLAGVVGCTAVDVVSILQKKREPVKGVTVEIKGTRAEEHPMVYTHAVIEYVVSGDVSPKAVEDAIKLSKTKYCSASIMLQRSGAEVTTTYRIVP
jgi:putative redox protein